MTGAGRQRVSFLPLSDRLAFLIETLRQIKVASLCQLLFNVRDHGVRKVAQDSIALIQRHLAGEIAARSFGR
jgi:hypothetical protein